MARKRQIAGWIACIVLLLAGCISGGRGGLAPTETLAIPQPPPAPRSPLAVTQAVAADAKQRTLDSLELVDDFPLYVMHLQGDYGFGEYIRSGRKQSRQPAQTAFACTGFTARTPQGERLMGRNFDWYRHPALLLFTDPPDGWASLSMVDISYLGYSGKLDLTDRLALEPLLEAPYLPFDGLNERGLAVGMMAIPHADGGDDARKVTLGELELIRLLLDYAGNLDEALALVEQYNVDVSDPPIHYLIADAGGNSAVVEFIDGRPQVFRSREGWQVSTNFLFAETPEDRRDGVCRRYAQAGQTLSRAGGELEADAAMDLLAGVSQNNTIWSLVYNLSRGEVSLAMDRKYESIYTYGLK